LIEPVKITLTGDGLTTFKAFLKDRLTGVKDGLNELHTNLLPEWRRVYEALPLEPSKMIPFENSSNLVIPIVGIHSDTLKARLLASLVKISPTWVVRAHGDFAGQSEPLSKALEEFLSALALEPDELDLYRVYNECLDDVIHYGTMFLKSPWENLVSSIATKGVNGQPQFVTQTDYDGPRPERIAIEDMFLSPTEKTIERASFKAHRRRLEKWEIEDRILRKLYDEKEAKAILSSPDRPGPDRAQAQQQQDSGIKSPYTAYSQEWDIYECWFWYRFGPHKAKVVATYHLKTDTLLRAYYSFLPDDPFVSARLLNRDGSFFGYGLCWLLGAFQEEISLMHNQRRDAQTVANTKVWRVDPFSKLHDGFKIYPSAMLPAKKDEIEPMSHGEPSGINIEEERLALELAERRTGVSPPQQSYGSGSFSKRGVYSATGTLSMLQEGNNRTDMSVGDVRYFHTKLGRIVARQYAALGINSSKFEQFGQQSENIKTALQNVLNKSMFLPISSPTASINREVEKQSDVMMVGMMTRHYQTVTTMLIQIQQMQVPPNVKDYMVKTMHAMNRLMRTVLKHFDYDDPEAYAPEVLSGPEQPQTEQPEGFESTATPQAGGSPMAGANGGTTLSGLPGIGTGVQ